MTKVLGLGNALVDIMTKLKNDSFLEEHSLPRGSMQLVDLKTFSDIPGSENLVVVAACSDPENISDLKTITKNLGLNYPVLLDEQAKVSQLYKAPFFPTTFIIDQSQNISFVREGYSPSIAKQLRDKVSSLLASDGSTK